LTLAWFHFITTPKEPNAPLLIAHPSDNRDDGVASTIIAGIALAILEKRSTGEQDTVKERDGA